MAGLEKVFALLNEEDEFQGFFKTLDKAMCEAEKNAMGDCKVFEVVNVYEIYAPEEPSYEANKLKLNSLGAK